MTSTTEAPAGRSEAPASSVRRRLRPGRADRRWWPFAAPTIVLTVAFFILPFLLNIYFAFTQWTGFSSVIAPNGLDNFRNLADSGVLWTATRVTVTYAVIAMLLQNVISLGLALLMQNTSPVNSFFRALFFLPVLISPLAAGYIWSAILEPQGPLNAVIGLVSPGFDHAWLGDTRTVLASVAFIDVWKWSGIVTLVYIAGLNAIPQSLVEAARIDGAGAWKIFWLVKFRLLAPAFTFSVVVSFLGALNAFDIIQATTRGGPGSASLVLNVALYRQYAGGFFGNASAISLTIAALVVVLGVPLIAALRRRELEG
ncbi:sugar ABC transporter permease [Phycicoccus sp. BSK3Z-2]|uniref:Sugar ABC transporter permease n=1 Tax=Phycicoccus avicenniae TaxID=2828860 RepID=A0A941HZ15_9MICO|nr:sugar ABC transporter permease [Phycicoccus avicenniae]MBR7741754.1 sugar ABC transporter permease [Phycicoccus avicenniae]